MLKATKAMRAKAAWQFPEESSLNHENKHWTGPQIPPSILPFIPRVASGEGFCSTFMDGKQR